MKIDLKDLQREVDSMSGFDTKYIHVKMYYFLALVILFLIQEHYQKPEASVSSTWDMGTDYMSSAEFRNKE